jgi:hypothetical protein
MKAKHNDVYEIIGICEHCQNEVWGRRLPDGDWVIEPCQCCLDEAFNQGHESGYADHMELEYRRWLDRRLRL